MKAPRIVEVVFNEDGSVSIDGKGFEGKECEILNELAKQLGVDLPKETRKPEYYKQRVSQKQKQR